MLTDRLLAIPPLALEIVDHVSNVMGLTAKTGEVVVVTWRNTIEMRHRLTRSPDQIFGVAARAASKRAITSDQFTRFLATTSPRVR